MHGQAEFRGNAHHQFFGALIIHAECAACDDDLHAFVTQGFEGLAHQRFVQLVGGDETMPRPQEAARRELDVLDVALTTCQHRFDAARHADDADRGDVAFEQARWSPAWCECARNTTSFGSTCERSSTLRKTSTTPSATPRASLCVVSTE